MNSIISVVILAAGKGTRMHSDLPKVLHTISGKPMIQYLIDVAHQLTVREVYLVYGHGGDLLKKTLKNQSIHWVLQEEQLGTGHAVKQVEPFFLKDEDILILYGDVPLISIETLSRLCAAKPKGGIALLTANLDDPSGYGRVIRKNGQLINIVEDSDANNVQRKIHEISTGILVANGKDLKRWLSKLTNNNIQGEYYISGIIPLAWEEGVEIAVVHPRCVNETKGVNNRLQLSHLERIYQAEQANRLLLEGVMLGDPERFDLRGTLHHGRDVKIDVNVILEGEVTLGNQVEIGVGCVIKNSIIGDGCKIRPYSIIENSVLKGVCTVGPFARFRPGVEILEGAHVGNFVEMKKTCLGRFSKVGHLTYLGDAKIGDQVNIGAGVITCNYDGTNKLKTVIGDDVFIGADTQLVAPVVIGQGATIAAGTTVTRDIEENQLVMNRVSWVYKKDWQRPTKKK